jgi:hypothetical protein
MAKIDDLNKSISSMSLDELHEHIRQTRNSRRTYKGGGKKKSKSIKKTGGGVIDASKHIETMSPEQRARLLQMLTGGKS